MKKLLPITLLLTVIGVGAVFGINSYRESQQRQTDEYAVRKAVGNLRRIKARFDESQLNMYHVTIGEVKNEARLANRGLNAIKLPDSKFQQIQGKCAIVEDAIDTGKRCAEILDALMDDSIRQNQAEREIQSAKADMRTYSDNPYIIGNSKKEIADASTRKEDASSVAKDHLVRLFNLRREWTEKLDKLKGL